MYVCMHKSMHARMHTYTYRSATKRLEGKQAAKYRPSAAYDKYYLSSNALLPRLV